MITCTHELHIVEDISDRCIVLKDGRIAGPGSVQYLKKSNRPYRKRQLTADRAAAGTLDRTRIRKVVLETVERVTGKRIDSPTVAEWLERWIRIEKDAVALGTLIRYEQIVRDFLSNIGALAQAPLEALSTDAILEFKARRSISRWPTECASGFSRSEPGLSTKQIETDAVNVAEEMRIPWHAFDCVAEVAIPDAK